MYSYNAHNFILISVYLYFLFWVLTTSIICFTIASNQLSCSLCIVYLVSEYRYLQIWWSRVQYFRFFLYHDSKRPPDVMRPPDTDVNGASLSSHSTYISFPPLSFKPERVSLGEAWIEIVNGSSFTTGRTVHAKQETKRKWIDIIGNGYIAGD